MTEIINFEDEGEMGSMGRYARHIAAKKSETKAPGPSAPFAELMRQPATSSRYAPPIAPEPEPPAPAEQEILAAPPKFNSNSEPTNGYAEPPDGAHGHHLPTAEPEVQAGALHEQLLAEPAPRHPALVAAWRDVATASDDGDKREAFQLAAIEIGGLVDSGDIEHAEGFDDLIDLGEEHRLFRGREDLEHVIGQGFKGIRALPVPKVNGQAKPAQPEGPEPPPATERPREQYKARQAEQAGIGGASAGELESVTAAAVEMEAVEWLWLNRFALGSLGLVVGLPDEGKGQIFAYIAATVTNGSKWPCGEGTAPKGRVLLLTAEDGLSNTVVPRLEAAGANRDMIEIVRMVRVGAGKRMFSFVTDLELLRQKILSYGDVKLVLIDPISAYLGNGKIDSFRGTDVRAVLTPLTDMAEELRVAFIGIMHFNKKTDVQNVVLRISDSLAFGAAARHVYAVVNDAENSRKLFVRGKNNIAPRLEKQALAYGFGVKEVGRDPKTNAVINAPYIEWDLKHVEISAAEAMQAAADNKATTPRARNEAKELLTNLLRDGPMSTKDVDEAAKANGISFNTLRRAKKDLGVQASKDGKAGWRWFLPPASKTAD